MKKLQTNYEDYPNFIETGTYKGGTIFNMEDYFSSLYTIEIKKEFYDNVKSKYQGDKIKFYHGNSGDVLNDILPSITGKTMIFLDRHWN